MLTSHAHPHLHTIESEIETLLRQLGAGHIAGAAYDTAWVARLSPHYPNHGFDESLEWLRENQADSGLWGTGLPHYHDRFISTLAAMVALQEAGTHSRDQRRVKRAEKALWKVVGYLRKDDCDTVGFPIAATALTRSAKQLGLDVPQPPIRQEASYNKKVAALLKQPASFWRTSPITFTYEGLQTPIAADDLLAVNHSVAMSPAATAALLMNQDSPRALSYLRQVLDIDGAGGAPDLAPIDTFEINWALSSLRIAGAIRPDHPEVQRLLHHLYSHWSPENGIGYSAYLPIPDLDDTIAAMTMFRWANMPITADVLSYYELPTHFCCYLNETDPSPSANARVFSTLKYFPEHPSTPARQAKVIQALQEFDQTGIFWWDKWHVSPYYTTYVVTEALYDTNIEMVAPRIRWIMRTQRDDGGWGHLGASTAEETAYCLSALLIWDRNVERVAPEMLHQAAQYILSHLNDKPIPMWIGKSLYLPTYIVRAAILSALYLYYADEDRRQ
jgi:halimadienyl-diphosphate synthase